MFLTQAGSELRSILWAGGGLRCLENHLQEHLNLCWALGKLHHGFLQISGAPRPKNQAGGLQAAPRVHLANLNTQGDEAEGGTLISSLRLAQWWPKS